MPRCYPCSLPNGSTMRHEDSRASRPFRAIGTQIGVSLRENYDLAEPPTQNLVDLLNRLDARVDRERTTSRLYAAVDEAIAALIDLGRNTCVGSGQWNDNELRLRSSRTTGPTERQAGPRPYVESPALAPVPGLPPDLWEGGPFGL
jgi:hypothetical protein